MFKYNKLHNKDKEVCAQASHQIMENNKFIIENNLVEKHDHDDINAQIDKIKRLSDSEHSHDEGA